MIFPPATIDFPDTFPVVFPDAFLDD